MIPVSKIRAWLQMPDDDPTHPADLAELRDRAVSYVEGATGRYFGPPEVVTESYNSFGGQVIFLNEAPIMTEPVVVLEVGTALPSGWLVEGGRLIREFPYYWPFGYRVVTVTYTRGYPVDAVTGEVDAPGDIKQAVLDLIAAWWGARGTEAYQSETIGGYSYTLASAGNAKHAAPPRVEATLQRYRRVRL